MKKAIDKPIGFPFRHGDYDGKDKHSPAGLQKRVADREMRKRGLDEAQGVAEGMFGLSAKDKAKIQYVTSKISDIPGNWDHKNQTYTERGLQDLKSVMKNEKYLKYALSLTSKDYDADLEETKGLSQGWMLKKDPELAKKVKQNTDLAKKRQQSYGDPSKGVSKNEDRDVIGSMAKRLTDPKDGATAKLRAAGDKRREQQMKSRDFAKRDDTKKDQWGDLKTEVSDEMIKRYFSGAMKDTISGKKDRNKGMTRAMSRMSGTNKPL